MNNNKITIKNNVTGELIVSNRHPLEVEGKFYFHIDKVSMDSLVVTGRTYTCTHKGVCNWIDIMTERGVQENVAWIYLRPTPGWEHLKTMVGFWPTGRGYITLEFHEGKP